MGDGMDPATAEHCDVNRVARLLIEEWERIEGPVTPSYVATFADIARAVLASPWLAAHVAAARAEERERWAGKVRALADEWEKGDLGYPDYAVVFIRELRALLPAPERREGDPAP